MDYILKQNYTSGLYPFKMVSSTDHRTGQTGKTVTGQRSKAGGAFAAISGTIQEIGLGWYRWDPANPDTDTTDNMLLLFDAAGCDTAEMRIQIVSFDPLDALRMGMTSLPPANSGALGGIIRRGTGAGDMNPSFGAVPVTGVDVAGALTGSVLPEAYPANGAAGTLAQLLYLLLANVGQMSILDLTFTALKLDGVTPAAVYSLDDAVNPTGRVRTG